MRADAYFEALAGCPFATLDALVGDGGLVVVAPHPDDESLGCGGLIAEARRRDRDVRIVFLSDGCGSHPRSRSHPPERLRALREEEGLRAVAELGVPVEHALFLRLPDASVPAAGSRAAEAAEAIVRVARAGGATALFTTWSRDPHCDHVAAAAIAKRARGSLGAVRLLAYSVWGWTLPAETEVGPPPRGFRFDVSAHRGRKRRAVAAHASQTTDLIADDPEGFRLAEGMIDRLCGPWETFVEVEA